jgi:hypothetical protein
MLLESSVRAIPALNPDHPMKRSALKLSALACLTAASTAQAITLTTATVTENFNGFGAVAPPIADWSTNANFATVPTTGTFAGGGGGITNVATFDSALALAAASDMAAALQVVTANGTNQQGKYVNSSVLGQFTSPHLATQSTGLSWTGIMGNLIVGGTSSLSGMSVVWDSAIDLASTAGATTDDGFANGHRLYYSVGGAVGSFKPVANYFFASGAAVNSTMLNNTANIVFDSPAAPGTSIYVVWGDDNALTNVDGAFAIDNVRFTGTAVPEPSLLGTMLFAVGMGVSRRRR